MKDRKKQPALIFMFGATGDLARRKLYPSLYRLYQKNYNFAVIGLARRPNSHLSFRRLVADTLPAGEDVSGFISRFYYQVLDVTQSEDFQPLKRLSDEINSLYHLAGNRIFYLSLAPDFFVSATEKLKKSGLTDTNGWKHLIIEKPFGHDLASAERLNKALLDVFSEHEIYRIDHYLGKEMIQNIEMLRFANPVFESIWNHQHISNVQITSSESIGVGERAGYYDRTGALLDMVQNHMMQMIALTGMEPPGRFTTEDIRDEKVKVIQSIRRITEKEIASEIVRGQYAEGMMQDGTVARGYRDEAQVGEHSMTETFIAARFFIDNYRWSGVPFYVRTGKRMARKSTDIVIQFNDIPNNPYFSPFEHVASNLLIIHVQPEPGISLRLNVRQFSETNATVPVTLNFSNNRISGKTSDAYERLLSDCLNGDATNFTRWDEVACSWSLVDSLVSAWKKQEVPLDFYEAGSMGPASADALLARDGFHWWPAEKD